MQSMSTVRSHVPFHAIHAIMFLLRCISYYDIGTLCMHPVLMKCSLVDYRTLCHRFHKKSKSCSTFRPVLDHHEHTFTTMLSKSTSLLERPITNVTLVLCFQVPSEVLPIFAKFLPNVERSSRATPLFC